MLSHIFFFACTSVTLAASSPSVTIKNGTLNGVALNSLRQELFLNIPYASTTGGENRFLPPKPPSSWSSPRDASAWGNICPGVGISSTPNASLNQNYVIGEDCLNINIIRPKGARKGDDLPILFFMLVFPPNSLFLFAQANDPRYNGSYLVERSVQLGKPIIFASINYRLNVFGFPSGPEAASSGSLNLGLKDQRQALLWVRENIAAFGGSPSKTTIWGQSAGGMSVASQMAAFGGVGNTVPNSDLFRAAIIDSGVFAASNASLESQTASWETFVNVTSCRSTPTLACLRGIPMADMLVASASTLYNPASVPDGDFLQLPIYEAIEQNKLAKVPLIINANKDEATSGIGAPTGIQNDAQLSANLLRSAFSDPARRNASLAKVLAAYPDDPSIGCPYDTGAGVLSTGLQDKRIFSIYTDTVVAGARHMASAHSKRLGSDMVWSGRFNQVPQNGTIEAGVAHLYEIPYIFGVRERTVRNPWGNRKGDLELSELMQTYWINFVNDLNPNGKNVLGHINWPSYSPSAPKNLVFLNDNTKVEDDTYRKNAVAVLDAI
ncbi:alpha/beta-hydrolase, partial [Mycena rebaudengoi]